MVATQMAVSHKHQQTLFIEAHFLSSESKLYTSSNHTSTARIIIKSFLCQSKYEYLQIFITKIHITYFHGYINIFMWSLF